MAPKKNYQYSLRYLEKQSYRHLQYIAKSMHLPANIKKVYLTQLIHAKHTGVEENVEKIIEKVKLERQEHISNLKLNVTLNHKQTPKSSRITGSPKIAMTSPLSSKTRNSKYKRFYSRQLLFRNPSASSPISENRNRVSLSCSNHAKLTLRSTTRDRKRSRIEPLSSPEQDLKVTELDICHSDGTRTKVPALVKNSLNSKRRLSSEMVEEYFNCINKLRTEVNLIKNSNIDPNDFITDQETLYVTDCLPESEINSGILEEINDNKDKYNNNIGDVDNIHQIIETALETGLPDFNDVFANFNSITQPLNIHSLKELEIVEEFSPNASPNTGTDKAYNLNDKSLLTICIPNRIDCFYGNVAGTTSTHKTVTDDIESPKQDELYEMAVTSPSSSESDGEHFQQWSSSNTREPSVESIDSTELLDIMEATVLGDNITISESFEDAFEYIGDDGNYLERIDMDTRVGCIFCIWSGPSTIYDSHMKREHPYQILTQVSNDCNISYCMGSVMHQKIWICRVLEIESILYVLRAKYEDPDCLMIAISTISHNETEVKTGSLTVYNKVTGEPYSWEGQINHSLSNLVSDNDNICLQMELSKLNLIPNSSNLRLLNKELVMESPTNVVVGQPELNDIFINIHVKIYT